MSADLAAAGLGLQYGIVRLVPAKHEWTAIAEELAAEISAALPAVATTVAHIGSMAVPGLLTKPLLVAVPAHPSDTPAGGRRHRPPDPP